MDLYLLILLIILIFMFGLGVYFLTTPLQKESVSADPKLGQNLRTYRIFTLGTSGAGKTCFMASMFNRLSSYKPDIGFYLEVPDNKQRILLQNVYNEMTDPYNEWPSGTVGESQWHFTSVVSANGSSYDVFRFTYLDYAGGHLTDPSQADLLDAQAKVAEADAVLVLLDGQKILHRLEGKEDLIDDPKKRIGAELNFVLPYLNKSPKKPIHFVISKWDLLEGKHSFAAVRNCLLRYENFAALIEQREQLKVPTRLIPVSAVGSGFARMSGGGRMKKNPNVDPQPFQVEMSIASTLIDAFEAATKDLSEQQFERLRQFSNIQDTTTAKMVSILKEGASVMADVLKVIVPFPWNFAPVAAARLLAVIHNNFEKSYEELRQDQRATLGMVGDQETAVNSVITSYQFLMRELEHKFPESTLYESVKNGDCR